MAIITEGLRVGHEPTIRELWADNLTSNVLLASQIAKILAATLAAAAVIWFLRWLFSAKTRPGRLLRLWLKVKERELQDRAAGKE